MGVSTVCKIEARFSADDQDTNLQITMSEKGMYDVLGAYTRLVRDGFPSHKTVKCIGQLFEPDVQSLLTKLLLTCKQQWYHHYRDRLRTSQTRRLSLEPSQTWSIRLDYADGFVRRWEGQGDGPENIDDLYNLLINFGMPRLSRPFGDYLNSLWKTPGEDRDAEQLYHYTSVLHETYQEGYGDERDAETYLVADELIEDITLFLDKYGDNMAYDEVFRTWCADDSIRGLCNVDVSLASRIQMKSLLWALTQVDDKRTAVFDMFGTGTWKRWCERLREIPVEEDMERRREINHQHKALIERVRESIRKRIASGEIFTSYDVAKDMDVSTQRASTCIRSFVRSGELKTVGNDYPRRYKAA